MATNESHVALRPLLVEQHFNDFLAKNWTEMLSGPTKTVTNGAVLAIGANSKFFLCSVVSNAHFPDDATAAAKIDEIHATFKAEQSPYCWRISAFSTPYSLFPTLQSKGFLPVDTIAYMCVDLEKEFVPPPHSPPDSFKVEEVTTSKHMLEYIDVFIPGYGVPPPAMERFQLRAKEGKTWSDLGVRMYLGYLDGKPVSTGMIFVGSDKRVAGVFYISTLPNHRKKGVGGAISFHCCQEAKKLGARYVVLGATEMGRPVYEKMGFTFTHYAAIFAHPEFLPQHYQSQSFQRGQLSDAATAKHP